MKKGDFIRINYIGRLESGEIFDITDEAAAKKEKVYNDKMKYGPLPVVVGANFLISGLDKAVEDMNVGDIKDITILPEDAFGQRDPKLVKTVNASVFRDNKTSPQQGMIVNFSGMKGRIQSVSGGRVRIDFNNPLSGKTLLYHVEIIEKIEGSKEKIESVLEFFGVNDASIKINDNEAEISARIPDKMKETISDIITSNVEGIAKIKFSETFEKK